MHHFIKKEAARNNCELNGYFIVIFYIFLVQCSCLDVVRNNALNYICRGPSVPPCTFENGTYRVCCLYIRTHTYIMWVITNTIIYFRVMCTMYVYEMCKIFVFIRSYSHVYICICTYTQFHYPGSYLRS